MGTRTPRVLFLMGLVSTGTEGMRWMKCEQTSVMIFLHERKKTSMRRMSRALGLRGWRLLVRLWIPSVLGSRRWEDDDWKE